MQTASQTPPFDGLRTAPTHRTATVEVWLWLLQRVTGVALVLLLALHIWLGHFANIGDVVAGLLNNPVEFRVVADRLQNAALMFVDFSLLALALYHGLNGVRAVAMDFGVSGRATRLLDALLTLVAIVAFIFGANTLWVFITGQALF